jgi:hypothetical protein
MTVICTAAQLLRELLLQLLLPIGSAAVAAVTDSPDANCGELRRAAVSQHFAANETGPD